MSSSAAAVALAVVTAASQAAVAAGATLTATTLPYDLSRATVGSPYMNRSGEVAADGTGQIIGYTSGRPLTVGMVSIDKALVWSGGSITDITRLGDGGSDVVALGDDGTVLARALPQPLIAGSCGVCYSGYFARKNGITLTFAGTPGTTVAKNGTFVSTVSVATDANDPFTQTVKAWHNLTATTLATYKSTGEIYANSINSAGVAVGDLQAPAVAGVLPPAQPVLFTGGKIVSLPVPAGSPDMGNLRIDDYGHILSNQVVWSGAVTNGVWSGTTTVLRPLPGDVSVNPFASSASGVIVGGSISSAYSARPVEWAPGAANPTLLPGAGETGYAIDINASGEIISTSTLWKGSTILHAAPDDSFNALNDSGKIYGFSYGTTGVSHALAWTVTGG